MAYRQSLSTIGTISMFESPLATCQSCDHPLHDAGKCLGSEAEQVCTCLTQRCPAYLNHRTWPDGPILRYLCTRTINHPHNQHVDREPTRLTPDGPMGWTSDVLGAGFNEPGEPDKAEAEDPQPSAVSESEAINHPQHYGGDTTYEAIKVIEAWGLGFCLGNTVKYISRAGKKAADKELEDLRKARWYLDREITRLESEDAVGIIAP